MVHIIQHILILLTHTLKFCTSIFKSVMNGLRSRTTDSASCERQNKHHLKANEFIKQGLLLDEKGARSPEEWKIVVEAYRSAVKEMEAGLKIELPPKATDSEKAVFQTTRNTMQVSLSKVKGRLSDLGQRPESRMFRSSTTLGMPTISSLAKSKHVPVASAATSSKRPTTSTTTSSTSLPTRSVTAPPVARTNSMRGIPGYGSLQRGTTGINTQGLDPKHVSIILDDIINVSSKEITFDDISGQETAKQALKEMVIMPTLRPDIFNGLRAPPKGLLLFGPPGNGKTLLAKAAAAETKSTFFNISASSLTSKWVGEGEKLVKTLFEVARQLQPAVIFVDEIDSILRERSESENEASRRLKTEFFLQMDGLKSSAEDRISVMGATNRPQELDDAILRRFPKRIYVSLPDRNARMNLLRHLLSSQNNPLSAKELSALADLTDGYSASDLTNLTKDAALGPVREYDIDQLKNLDQRKLRKINFQDFVHSIEKVRKSVSPASLQAFEKWNAEFGDISV